MVQVRNAVFVVSAVSIDAHERLPTAASLTKTAADAVDALHQFGWP